MLRWVCAVGCIYHKPSRPSSTASGRQWDRVAATCLDVTAQPRTTSTLDRSSCATSWRDASSTAGWRWPSLPSPAWASSSLSASSTATRRDTCRVSTVALRTREIQQKLEGAALRGRPLWGRPCSIFTMRISFFVRVKAHVPKTIRKKK